MINLKRFGSILRDIRSSKGLTLKDFSKRSGYTVVHISRIESGVQTPTLQSMERLCTSIDLNPQEILILSIDYSDLEPIQKKLGKRLNV